MNSTQPPIFEFWPRNNVQPRNTAVIGARIQLDERVEHIFQFNRALTDFEKRQLHVLGGELLSENTAILDLGNFVGSTELAGVGIDVVSTKVGPNGVSRILEEVSELASTLIFSWKTPLSFAAAANYEQNAPVPYHQVQFIRQKVLRSRLGERLQDFLGTIERNPTRRFERDRPVLPLTQLRRIDQRALQSVFARLDRLVPVSAGSTISKSPLARKLTFGAPPQPHFPEKIASPRGNLSFDTPENRFAKHVLLDSLSLVYRFAEHPKLHPQFQSDCREVIAILEQFLTAPFIDEAGALSSFSAPSQTLVKADGYRELFEYWDELRRHVSLPSTADETQRLLEGRNMATLYEYWVFLRVLKAVSQVVGSEPSSEPQITRSELGESLSLGLTTKAGSKVSVSFNPSYSRSDRTAYSTPLRPDVVVQIGDHRFAFDAKYRLTRLDLQEGDTDEGLLTYKRADLYKMHAYRDAIQPLQAAFVVYPGDEFVFFEHTGLKSSSPDKIGLADGVGVVPLKPADSNAAHILDALMRTLLGPLLTLPSSELAPK